MSQTKPKSPEKPDLSQEPGSSPVKKQKKESPIKKQTTDALSQLKQFTKIVADTGNFTEIEKYAPEDATTNPTLILQVSKQEQFQSMIDEALEYGKKYFQVKTGRSSTRKTKASLKKQEIETKDQPRVDYKSLEQNEQKNFLNFVIDQLCVLFGKKILEHIPGVVSTEVDARLSFDTKATIDRALNVIRMYEEKGINRNKILIKIASTWEGIEAAKLLKKEKINCNLTLLFSHCQAVACGEAGVFLISPFVGRILDWFKKDQPNDDFSKEKDPGYQRVQSIYNYYKKFDIQTIVMGASFRNIDEILLLSGCDKLTISPKLLDELQCKNDIQVERNLSVEAAKKLDIQQLHLGEKEFRWMLNEDRMATEKLAEGIRNFAKDIDKLEELLHEKLMQQTL